MKDKIGVLVTAMLIGAYIYTHEWHTVLAWVCVLLTELRIIALKK